MSGEGEITLANGKPLDGRHGLLRPTEGKGAEANGKVGPDGAFLATNGKDGVIPGEYRVRVEPDIDRGSAPPERASPSAATCRSRPSYGDETPSSLKFTVNAGTNAADSPAQADHRHRVQRPRPRSLISGRRQHHTPSVPPRPFFFERKDSSMSSPIVVPTPRLHPDRAAGGHRHHRRADRPAAAGRAGRPARPPAAPSAPTT